jgi:amine acid ABC transporter, permease protein, 3-TM region, His/Glu/Gln/Arg/opine family
MHMSDRTFQIIVESFWPIVKAGLQYTIPLTICSFLLGLIIAILVALIQIANIKILKQIVKIYVWIFRGTPMLVQIFIIFFGLPKAGILLDPFPAAIIAFSLNVGAYSSETIRAAILSVPKGQWEAGYAFGMTFSQVFRRIILKQAAKVSIPPLSNTFIGLVKDTSLASTITLTEMFMVTQRIVAFRYEPLLLYCELAVIYLGLCSVLNILQSYLEKKLVH